MRHRFDGNNDEPEESKEHEQDEKEKKEKTENDKTEEMRNNLRNELNEKFEKEEKRKEDREEFQSNYKKEDVEKIKENDPEQYERIQAANKMATREELDEAAGGETCWDSMSTKEKMDMLKDNPDRAKALQQDYEDRHPYGMDEEDQTDYMKEMKNENLAASKAERDKNDGIPEDMLESDNPYEEFVDKKGDGSENSSMEQETEKKDEDLEQLDADDLAESYSEEDIDDLIQRNENYDYKGIDYDEMDDEEFSEYADELYDEYSGLNYDIHEDYDEQIKAEQEKVDDESLSDEERQEASEKLQKYQDAVDEYNETGHQPDVIWPENDGFEGEVHRETLESGTIVSRYSDKGADGGAGSYASPAETNYEDRAVPYFEDKKEEHFYRVEEGKSVEVNAGNVREFRGEESTGATQYQFDKPINEYVQDGTMYECNKDGHRINENGDLINKEGHLVDEQDRPINEDGHLVDEQDRPINEEGHLVDEQDRPINEEGHLVDEQGRLINEDGHLVNENDELIDENGNLVDENDNIIE